MIRFRLDPKSGVPAYRQIIDQVHHALRLGRLAPGDQLPTVREVVAQVTINPNTVHRAYRDLEAQGLVHARMGQGTFVTRSLASAPPARQSSLARQMDTWIAAARKAGLDDETIRAIFAGAMEKLPAQEAG